MTSGEFAKRHLAGILIKSVILRIEVGDEEVRCAISVNVTGIHAHACARDAVRIECDLCFESGVAEAFRSSGSSEADWEKHRALTKRSTQPSALTSIATTPERSPHLVEE